MTSIAFRMFIGRHFEDVLKKMFTTFVMLVCTVWSNAVSIKNKCVICIMLQVLSVQCIHMNILVLSRELSFS